MVGTANMAGRGIWGPVSDLLGRGRTFGIFGFLSIPSLLALPIATGMVQSDPDTALQLFQAASLLTVGGEKQVPPEFDKRKLMRRFAVLA